MIVSRAVILFLFCCFSFVVLAQNTSTPGGRFSIAEQKACPLTVTFNIPECTSGGLDCTIDYLGNNNFVGVLDGHTFFYDTPGVYTVTVIFGTTGSEQLTLEITPDTPPTFDLYTCNGNQVQLNITDTSYDQYIINYNDATPEAMVPSGSTPYAYGSSGPKTVSVRGINTGAADNCSSHDKPITVVSTPPGRRITQLEVTQPGEIVLDLEQGPQFASTLYRLEMSTDNGTTFTPLQDVYNTDQVTVTNIDTENHYYCFRLATADPCAGTFSYGGSNTVCSADLNLAIQNNRNQLTWSTTAAGGLVDFTISKTPGTPPANQPNTATSYPDDDVRCGTEYCYRLISNYAGAQSISNQVCGTAISNDIPTVIDNISTVVNDNTVALQWIQDPAFTPGDYTIRRSPDFTPVGNSATPSFTDNRYDTQAGFCYTIGYRDVCGNTSPESPEVCPIQLTATLQQGDNSVLLTWPPYNGYRDGVDHYEIEKYNSEGSLIEAIEAQSGFLDENTDVENQVFTYRIVAYPADPALASSISNVVTIIKSPNIFYPTAFVPNSGIEANKRFRVSGQYHTAFLMRIFNRWGEMLFETTDIEEGWDGTFKGNILPEGTYVFHAEFTDQAGRTHERSGSIVLLRK